MSYRDTRFTLSLFHKYIMRITCCRFIVRQNYAFLHSYIPGKTHFRLMMSDELSLNSDKYNFSSCHSRLFTSWNVCESSNLDEKETTNISNSVLSKIKYNCILAKSKEKLSWGRTQSLKKLRHKTEQERRKLTVDTPYALKYLDENFAEDSRDSKEDINKIVFPFQKSRSELLKESNETELSKFYSNRSIDFKKYRTEAIPITKNWMENYEAFDGDEMTQDLERKKLLLNYGTPDNSIPISNVPCGGCGSLLHCQDVGLPGYLPSELFKNCTAAELKALKCQRCHFLETFNVALNVNVAPEDYTLLLSRIKDQRVLVLVLVDVTDFPCSLWPNILDVIGTKCPVIVVANKVDLLPRDSSQFVTYVQKWLKNAIKESPLAKANVKHVSLISAKTGFGIESLITRMHSHWYSRGDVYLLGCTNVGKSTLFNTLLRSDYCKVQAVDLVLRATTSLWPGTTLNLLKFPIMRPDGHRLYQRVLRLQELQRAQNRAEKVLKEILMKSRNPALATLVGEVGTTFANVSEAMGPLDPFSVRQSEFGGKVNFPGLDPGRKEFAKSKWCYDTPGTIHPDQILDILTAQELVHLMPRAMILPRTFRLHAGDSLLVAGVGRIDFEGGAEKCLLTVFAAESLPITICLTDDVESVYQSLATSNLLVVPSSEPERLAQWPGLAPYPDVITVEGYKGESTADLVLSSAGWVSITPKEGETCVLKAWTPFGKGIHVRQPPLMRYSFRWHGKRMKKSPAYQVGSAVRV